MEEYVAQTMPQVKAFFMWQVSPTVIFGRNQVIHNEVNTAYCTEHGIAFYRRKSGGGAVFANADNVMLSVILPGDSVVDLFADYSSAVAQMLCSLGVEAEASGRNDVTIGGRKVSGGAFYRLPANNIMHSTMLLSTDLEAMTAALTPSRQKLTAKGVASVRSRITTLREHLPNLTADEFIAHARRQLCGDKVVHLTAADVAAIERIAEPYFAHSWIYGSKSAAKPQRIDGVGEFNVNYSLIDNAMHQVRLLGDFFSPCGDIAPLENALEGVEPTPQAIDAALSGINPGDYIAGLTANQLKSLLIPSPDNE
jgi:lipoyltransferase/lipoate-protein ligase